MKRIAIAISFVLISLLAISQNAVIKQVSPGQFQQLIKNPKGILLDVRTHSEYGNGHIANSGQLNYYALDFRKRLLLLPKSDPIFLYCNTGYRSQKAAEILAENGHQNVYNLEHGIMDWELKNLPVVVDPGARPDTDNKMGFSEYAKLIQSKELVFIDFYAPWCGPCRKMMPMMDSLKVEYQNRINIVKVNVDASKSLVKELKLVGVPFLAVYKSGKLLYSKNGAVSRSELTGVFLSNLAKD
ncbi:MAG: thioredoxin domain-containing protein [Prolixibacteraceae bacterium]|jgi:thioredoxin|nr:thioredoxin domain-containing protein [Prolixibacteraceae bacterium]